MKRSIGESCFLCPVIYVLLFLCTALFSFVNAHADCIGGVGADSIVISNKPIDYYGYGDVVECVAPSSITVGPYVTITDGVIFDLMAPNVFILPDVAALYGSQIQITTVGPMNDTGIVRCSDDVGYVPCPVPTHPGQDAEYGRDVTHNDDSDGYAGFSFTKLDAQGNPLRPDAAAWNCVRDNVTDLIWEAKTTDGGLHHWLDEYNWYNTDPDTNGGSAGYTDDDGAICYGYNSSDPASFCNTEAYTARVNQEGWCGYHDWRIPTPEELRTLVDYSVTSIVPTIDTDYFPNTTKTNHWSSLPLALDSDQAWFMNFYYGQVSVRTKDYDHKLMLVRDRH